MAKLLSIFSMLLFSLQITAQNENQQSTTGKIPPMGVDVTGHISDGKDIAVQQIIPGVPPYLWQHGCGPTSVGMVAGYYALNGFPGLISGNASTQTAAVNSAIASQENYNDYCVPEDSYPNLLSDLSELPAGDEHLNNSIADFMYTSQSYYSNYYGWSWSSDIKPSWENYISYKNAGYVGQCTKYYFNSFPWDSIVSNVNSNRPLVFLVDTDGDGSTDHFVCVNGYMTDLGINYYGCFNTWDSNQHWYTYAQIANGTQWGVYSCFTFRIYTLNNVTEQKSNIANNLKCYPNPFNGYTSISFNYHKGNEYSLVILNSMGQTVKSFDNITGEYVLLNREDLDEGIYIVQLICNHRITDYKKIIVQ